MFELFYNLRAEPFRLSPDHRFCYEHKGYAKARAYMAYAFMRAEGFVMITGRPGTGKTTLIGDLIESLGQDNVTTANLVCTQLQADDLLKTVAYSFGIDEGPSDKAELLQRLNVLLHKWHRTGRRALGRLQHLRAAPKHPVVARLRRHLVGFVRRGCRLPPAVGNLDGRTPRRRGRGSAAKSQPRSLLCRGSPNPAPERSRYRAGVRGLRTLRAHIDCPPPP